MFHHRNSEITIGMLFFIDFSNIQRYTLFFFLATLTYTLGPLPHPHTPIFCL